VLVGTPAADYSPRERPAVPLDDLRVVR